MDRQQYIDDLFEAVINKTDDFTGLLQLLKDSDDEFIRPLNCMSVLINDIKNELIQICEKLRNE